MIQATSLAIADSAYRCAAQYRLAVHLVESADFQRFSLALRTFERSLGELADDDDWKPWLRALRRYRFEASAAPLPFDHPAIISVENILTLEQHISGFDQVYPTYVEPARLVLDDLTALVASKANPLLSAMENLMATAGGDALALLVNEPRLIRPVTSVLISRAQMGEVVPISPSQLRGSHCYRKLLVVGPLRWYPEHVFVASRASEIDLISYNWIHDRFSIEPAFLGSQGRVRDCLSTHIVTRDVFGDGRIDVRSDDWVEAREVLPVVDWDTISRADAAEPDEHIVDPVEARLFLLSQNRAVYLDAEENSTTLVIDLDEDGDSRLNKMNVRSIEPGVFVLLRTEGGGDYIVPIADQIMGGHALEAREAQRHWKALLRHRVKARGMQSVVNDLIRHGALHANDLNVRNWMSLRSIRPEADADFMAILKLVGLKSDANRYSSLMKLISRAHVNAGQRIRKLLLAQVANSDLWELEQMGTMDFVLEDAAGGSLTAYRVEDISPQRFMIHPSRLGHPFSVEGDLWRG